MLGRGAQGRLHAALTPVLGQTLTLTLSEHDKRFYDLLRGEYFVCCVHPRGDSHEDAVGRGQVWWFADTVVIHDHKGVLLLGPTRWQFCAEQRSHNEGRGDRAPKCREFYRIEFLVAKREGSKIPVRIYEDGDGEAPKRGAVRVQAQPARPAPAVKLEAGARDRDEAKVAPPRQQGSGRKSSQRHMSPEVSRKRARDDVPLPQPPSAPKAKKSVKAKEAIKIEALPVLPPAAAPILGSPRPAIAMSPPPSPPSSPPAAVPLRAPMPRAPAHVPGRAGPADQLLLERLGVTIREELKRAGDRIFNRMGMELQ